MDSLTSLLQTLAQTIDGELQYDTVSKILYATDASDFREIPWAVVFPKHKQDIHHIIRFAHRYSIPIIPRGAGTSLAGQVVGQGLVVDISKYCNHLLEINTKERWVRVEPGIVRDDLNLLLKPYGLFFAPETSTSNRCTIGGMVGNNSCGLHSLIYGSTREHLLEATVFTSDGEELQLKNISRTELQHILHSNEGKATHLYHSLQSLLRSADTQNKIRENYPHANIPRRNHGYAIDKLLDTVLCCNATENEVNLCQLLCGSEGTLAFATELKLNLEPLPPRYQALLCVHCKTLQETCEANIVALQHHPRAIELLDDNIIALAAANPEQKTNLFFVNGLPKTILITEFAAETSEELNHLLFSLEQDLRKHHLGYAYPQIQGRQMQQVWNLRKAGLGLLANQKGNFKTVSVIEDAAVAPEDLYNYLSDMETMLQGLGLSCVLHGHIATGELHLRPLLNLKRNDHVKLYAQVAHETAKLVKKHHGSLSGEHGDGRLRGHFISFMYGEEVYEILRSVKKTWDPKGIFNPGKIIDTPHLTESLRYAGLSDQLHIPSYHDFSTTGGFLCAIEHCSGSADCRKSITAGGGMCPTFRATGKEYMSTRGRANVMRELISRPQNKKSPFANEHIKNILEDCLSCKACKTECPSNVDMAKLKSEYLQHYYDQKGYPLRTLLTAFLPRWQKTGAIFPSLYNFVVDGPYVSTLLKKVLQFAPQRPLPRLGKITLRHYAKHCPAPKHKNRGKIFLFADEFTNYIDVKIGVAAIELLHKLGYMVEIPRHKESGRTYISKGLLKKAKKTARYNVAALQPFISNETPLIGVEPSTILSFRDEYPDLLPEDRSTVEALGKNCLLIHEFLLREWNAGILSEQDFTPTPCTILLHPHCQSKAIAGITSVIDLFSHFKGVDIKITDEGCCGMAGAFGYEKKHYRLSRSIGEMQLFPVVRAAKDSDIICAEGTSCRSHIHHFTGKEVLHPVEILNRWVK